MRRMRKNRRRTRHRQFDSGPLSAKSLAQFDPMAYGSDVHVVARSGYPAVSIRFPVGFRDACNVGGSVGFASFALWLGALRERGTGPISKQIVEDMATGRWGMVTNNSEVFIDANLYTDDIVEGTIWITELTGPDRATTNLHVEWSRVDGETRTHIGWSAMQTTWVEILSHGVVAARPMPQYFHDFIEPMTIPTGTKNIAVPTEPKNVDRGSVIRSAPMVPRNPYLLESEVFSTTLQDGNVVGNIYFGNYYICSRGFGTSSWSVLSVRPWRPEALSGNFVVCTPGLSICARSCRSTTSWSRCPCLPSTRGGSTSSSSTSRSMRDGSREKLAIARTELSGRCRALRENWKSLRRRNFHSR